MKEMVCPECKGKSFTKVGADTYECNYCGATIKEEIVKPVAQQSAPTSNPVNVNVNVNNQANQWPQPKPVSAKMTGCFVGFAIIIVLLFFKGCGLL